MRGHENGVALSSLGRSESGESHPENAGPGRTRPTRLDEPARNVHELNVPRSATRPFHQLRLARHRSVFRAGNEADHLFEVLSGAVMIHRLLNDGRRQLVEIVFPGGFCGMTSGEYYESDCETLMPTVLRSHRKVELFQSHGNSARFADRLQRQVLAMHDHVVSLGRKTAEERICTLILHLLAASKLSEDGSDNRPARAFSLPMTRTEIADYLGLTIGTVSRTLSDLNRRKLVGLDRNKTEIVVLDLEQLRLAACWDAR
jgi:CRP/FNR family transcriptional regulator, nitrogen fixation regulation protein